jgi:selenocysteine lyase/cysteine desulfurase
MPEGLLLYEVENACVSNSRGDKMISRRTFVAGGMAGLAAGTQGACGTDSYRGQRPELVVPSAPDDDAWATVKAQFDTDASVTYLNNASLGMPPAVVAEAVARGYASHSQDPLQAKHELREIIADRTMPNLAAFLGVDVDEIVLTRNATEALHLQAIGLELGPGDEVLMTTQEHPAGARPWRYREAREGIILSEVFIPSPFERPGQVVELVASRITSRTRAIAFCHVTRGGHLYPVKDLCSVARERGIATVVDGAQALGMFPIDVRDLGCDVYAASLHKWVLAPIGTGVWYLRRDARERWRSPFEPEPTQESPSYAPGGTADLPVRVAIDTALGFIQDIGVDSISARNRFLSDYLKAQLAEMDGVRMLSGASRETSAPGSTIFELDGVDPIAAVADLDARRLYIDEHVRDGHQAFRISTHFYNTVEEIDRVVEALREL